MKILHQKKISVSKIGEIVLLDFPKAKGTSQLPQPGEAPLSCIASSHQDQRVRELSELVLQLGVPEFPSLVWALEPWVHMGLSLTQFCPQISSTAHLGARICLVSQAQSLLN